MSAVRTYLDLVKWDWVREMKRKDTLISMVLFSAVALMIFSFAIPPESQVGVAARAGLLWVTLLLAGTIGIDRAFRGEGQSRTLIGLLVAPVGRVTFYYARLTSTILLVAIMALVVLVAFCLLYNVSLDGWQMLGLAVTVLGGMIGFAAAGLTLSAMTRVIHGGEVLLRILLFPLLIPLFLASVQLTDRLFDGREIKIQSVVMIVAFDIIYTCAGQILFEVVMRDVD
ncbi:MAG: heme exporter protein CcmB [Planctomycetota bacterium]